MKEVMAVIRRDKIAPTRKALEDIGLGAMTIHSVNGRGRHGGTPITEIDPSIPAEFDAVSKITRHMTPASYALVHSLARPVFWIPKRMVQVVVPDGKVGAVVEAIMGANRTGYYGDGRIFVSPIEEAVQIRTGEKGDKTLIPV